MVLENATTVIDEVLWRGLLPRLVTILNGWDARGLFWSTGLILPDYISEALMSQFKKAPFDEVSRWLLGSFIEDRQPFDDYNMMKVHTGLGEVRLVSKIAEDTGAESWLNALNVQCRIPADDPYLVRIWTERLSDVGLMDDSWRLPLCFRDMLRHLPALNITHPIILAGLGKADELQAELKTFNKVVLQAAVFSGNTACVAVVLGAP